MYEKQYEQHLEATFNFLMFKIFLIALLLYQLDDVSNTFPYYLFVTLNTFQICDAVAQEFENV